MAAGPPAAGRGAHQSHPASLGAAPAAAAAAAAPRRRPPLPALLPLSTDDQAGIEILTVGDILAGAAGGLEARRAHRWYVEMTPAERAAAKAAAVAAAAAKR